MFGGHEGPSFGGLELDAGFAGTDPCPLIMDANAARRSKKLLVLRAYINKRRSCKGGRSF
jgi:hypothetical protein